MRKIFIYFATLACIISIISCTQREDVDIKDIKVDRLFSAYMADDSITKTIIDGEIGDDYRETLWLPGDSVGITIGNGKPVEKFVNVQTVTSELALLEGSISSKGTFYAIYPYKVSLKMESNCFIFDIPSFQKYQKNSFTSDAAPMVAKLDIVDTDQNLYFKNLCGVLIVNLTGDQKVKSITFTGKNEAGENMKVSGKWSVDMTYTDTPIITPTDSSSTSVTLQSEEGVQLDPVTPTPFYIVLPPATYHTFSVMVTTTDGKFMFKEATKPLTIKRANVTSAASLIYTESIGIDLSEKGTANCYIVSEPGVYSFDASLIGNGKAGIITDAGFHTDTPMIFPESAEVYWSDKILLTSTSFDKVSGKITFSYNGDEGNAVIATKDAEGNILWSWHIWCTDQPQEQKYVNSAGTFYVLDRNMGATRGDKGDGEQWKESCGLEYQFGRKDPFSNGSLSQINTLYTIEESILNPTHKSKWETKEALWATTQKTIYDPCPLGYRVSSSDIWTDFSIESTEGNFDHGWNFVCNDQGGISWYPTRAYQLDNSISYWGDNYMLCAGGTGQGIYFSASDVHMISNDYGHIRCMKDENFVDASLPVIIIKEIINITSTSVTLVSEITSEGKSEVIEKGVIVGTTPNVSLVNGTVYKSDSGIGEFEVEAIGLEVLSKYYVKAYATNSNGTAYSDVMMFVTDYGLEEINLSQGGTANSYIVSQIGKYIFDVSTIGNGYAGIINDAGFHTSSPLISPSSVELLWTDSEDLLGNIEFDVESCAARFTYIEGKGNAVIAAKDAEGNILWSWHIWCTDKPQEQKYANSAGIFYVLDRNLGAIRADRGTGDEWKESMGTLYFWGRKDPFGANTGNSAGESLTIMQTIENPQIRHHTSGWAHGNTSWMAQHIQKAWNSEQKTIYDPCPLGYIVASSQIWKGFTTTGKLVNDMSEINANGTYDNGWNFYIDESETLSAWYPLSHAYEYMSGNYCEINEGQNSVWSSDNLYNTDRNALRLVYKSKNEVSVGINPTADGYALPVRCMKDEAYVSVVSPIVAIKEIKEISATTATLVGEVVSAGKGDVTDRGFILGSTPDISLDNGTVYKCESGIGEYSLPLEELTSLTKYYVKAYAVNEYGTSYSQVQSFTTDYEGDAINLSIDGTANTYLVRDQGRDFIFDASVKGNSTDLVGSPASAEVLWETKNTDESVSKGDIISSVSLMEGGFVQFSIPNEYTPGNALIAVKDANGVILWSWHIWVADFDPVTTQQTYQSGAVMMDRNLGALNVKENDPRAYGFLYQWGRKDPMGGVATANSFAQTYPANIFTRDVTNSITEAIQNPTHFGNTPWSTDNTLWASVKTKYDPCPAGWRVPDGGPDGVWSGFGIYSQDVTNGAYFDAPYSTPKAFYPRGGYGYCNDTEVYFHSSTSYHWSCTINGSDVYDFQLWSGRGLPEDSRDKSSLFNVRCQKDEAQSAVSIPAVQIKEVKDVTQDGVTVVSEVIRDGRSSVIEKGVLVGETPDLTIDNALKVVKSESEENEFTLTVNDLLDGTKYYVRSYAKNSAGIGYSETRSFTTPFGDIVEDLCVYGTANSYIVTQTGTYKIKPVKGNSLESVGEVHSAEVLWETFGSSVAPREGDLISSIGYKDGYVIFKVHDPYKEGNAVIAAKDENGTILWSWHIWLTDRPQEHIYPNNAGTMMDRNLGATSATPGDVGALGLFYQWGRKDPFLGSSSISESVQTASTLIWPSIVSANNVNVTIEYVLANPTTFITTNNNSHDWLYTGTSENDNTRWTTSGAVKSIYDPCPEGWRVPEGGDNGVWARANFTNVTFDSVNKGVSFVLSSSSHAWYPASGCLDFSQGELQTVGTGGDYWSSSPDNLDAHILYFSSYGEYKPTFSEWRPRGQSIRCIKDEIYVTESLPTVVLGDVKDVTSVSVNVLANVTKSGFKPVTERGVIYSESTGVTLDRGTVVKEGDGLGEFTVTLTGLKPATHYYIRSYAKSDMGVSYSDEVRVITLNDGTYHDLSINGTANSYIVNKYGYYSFNATVKGNSTTPLEATPVSAEVLWETRNTAESITVGCVVKDVTFEDGRVKFATSDDVTPGNALIAVKDTDGYILWSWHIWVVDYNPEVQYHTYPSGAVMMDRDLGALSNGTDVQSNGLLYQWGRKDPFMGVGGNNVPAVTAPSKAVKYEKTSAAKGTLAYVETIPTTMLYNDNNRQDWLYVRDHSLWGADKTMYDPCPNGWKVPDQSYGVWNNLTDVHYSSTGYSIENTNAEFGTSHWTSISPENNERAYSKNGERGKVNPMRVRCVMESGLDIQIEKIASEDKSVNVVSSVSSIAAEKIKEWGVLCSTSNTNLLITSDDVFKSADGEAGKSFGKFELSLDGLNPNSTYYLRVYVVSERGIEYSDIHTFQTKVSGDNEDFGDEDYEW